MHISLLKNKELQDKIIKKTIQSLYKIEDDSIESLALGIENYTKESIAKIDVKEMLGKLQSDGLNAYDDAGDYKTKRAKSYQSIDDSINATFKVYKELPSQSANNFRVASDIVLESLAGGKITLKQAVDEFAGNFKGGYVNYKNGAKFPFDKYMEMYYRTSLTKMCSDRSKEVARDLGTEIYEYSSHANAADRCSMLQGQLVAYGKVSNAKDGAGNSIKVLNLYDYGYGTAGGPQGVNCGHLMFPFVSGISNRIIVKDDIIKNILGGE